LPKYAWYEKNAEEKTWPVGSLKPNDLGLFDVQGNAWTWCQERTQPYPQARGGRVLEDKEDILSINPTAVRVLRGGSFITHASDVRSAQRLYNAPADRFNYLGFRPARTLPLDKFTALQDSPEGGRK
jgi:formylglycine-generating enzyme required for sulfatase activity